MDAPASRARRTSFAYSSGVYGIPGHCCLFATAPETAHVMMQGSSTDITVLSGPLRIRARLLGVPEILPDHHHLPEAHAFIDPSPCGRGPQHGHSVAEIPGVIDGGLRHRRADAAPTSLGKRGHVVHGGQ